MEHGNKKKEKNKERKKERKKINSNTINDNRLSITTLLLLNYCLFFSRNKRVEYKMGKNKINKIVKKRKKDNCISVLLIKESFIKEIL